jgi:L-asparaginase / beta-aspartyl-peptidase
MTADAEAVHRAGLAAALDAGAVVLRGGGAALDAVEAAVRVLEDDPIFNAGRGAVFNAEGRNELDASIMDGASLKAGAVAGATRARHPVTLARTVMTKSALVMLVGGGADAFADVHDVEPVDPAFFFTEERRAALQAELDGRGRPDVGAGRGTVGAVAREAAGHLAAATSTGGFTGKPVGRVGDSAVIGAGTYADDASCAVSATGAGEYFIRLGAARELCALVEHKGLSAQQAADEVIQRRLAPLGGDGGLIAIGREGPAVWSYNTGTLFRATVGEDHPPLIAIFTDEP